VVGGGLVIIGAILAILLVIVAEVYPLFLPASVTALPTRDLGRVGVPAGDAFGTDEYRDLAWALGDDGVMRFTAIGADRAVPPVALPGFGAATITAVAGDGRDGYVAATSDGRVASFTLKFIADFVDGRRVLRPEVAFGELAAIDTAGRSVPRVVTGTSAGGPVVVAQVGPTDLVIRSTVERKALIGASRKEDSVLPLSVAGDGDVTALVLDGRGEELVIGTARGQIVRYDLRDVASPARADVATAARNGAITVLGFLNGDRTLVVGDASGAVSTWQLVPVPGGRAARLTRIHTFTPHTSAVVAVTRSHRNKGFATGDAAGGVHLEYATSGQTLATIPPAGDGLRALVMSPKADGLLALDRKGRIAQWAVDNPHPEATLATLFSKVWYEGYSEPAYVWQSTGGTDDFETKLSLTPLIYGTLKGTVYALLFAVPIALLAAVYVSEFIHPSLKGYLKPVVEIMAALPSVVLGFLAGLWLAPVIERVVPGLFLLPFTLTAAILAGLLAWRAIPARVRGRWRAGSEVVMLLPLAVLAGAAAFGLGALVEQHLLGGDYRGWLLSALGLTYDQRNSLVVGVAMGFAVIPIIFTIAEDSLANVPQHLRAGSLALGATRWQTALRVVLPTASPGIFSAVMIGFGRAVGETMIVLMATGNTPVMDSSIFSGFRALSANIAVELPEAPEGGTLFRVLFLAAFLLFCLTFVVNTIAEVVRLRLRRRYRYL